MNNALVITLLSFVALIAAYFVYGRFLARRIFQLDPDRRTPAHALEDGVDYVPTRVPVLFGHHFASIAGLGPILGPAIAVIWGWLPAVLWVVFGCIFMGAVHDLGALTVSLRFKGRSVGDICQELIGPRARLLFLIVIFFLMSLAMGAFVHAITSLFLNFNPDAIIPSFGLMFVAVGVGIAVYRLKVGLGPATIVGLALFAGLIFLGEKVPVPTYEWFLSEKGMLQTRQARAEAKLEAPYGALDLVKHYKKTGNTEALDELMSVIGNPAKDEMGSAQITWIVVLLGYGFLASVLPVWLLLQPRDYINSFQLYFALGLIVVGLVVAAIVGSEFNVINAEPIRTVKDAPPMFPFLFVTIACGAISGFHSLVSSGTTVRQMNKETDALPVGYGAMLTEGALAVLVIMACVAGLGAAAWAPGGTYSSWQGINGGGLGAQLAAVVDGGANFLSMAGIPTALGSTFLAVTIVAFALTTLDSATRLLRFNVEEIFRSIGLSALSDRYTASFVAVLGIAGFSLIPAGKTLWVLFGTTNQLLAGLTLATVSLFLYKLSRPMWYTLVPMVIMLTMTMWAMIDKLFDFYAKGMWSLVVFSVFVIGMSVWLLVEAGLSFARGRGGLDFGDAPALESKEEEAAASTAHLG